MLTELKATFINPPMICKTRKSGKETNWMEWMVCHNCEETTSHNLIDVEDGFFYRCRVCHFETETTSNSTLEIVEEILNVYAESSMKKEGEK